MKCRKCGEDASGIGRFCERVMGKEHIARRKFILTVYCCGKDIAKAVAASDVLYCGCCKPLPSPMEALARKLDSLKGMGHANEIMEDGEKMYKVIMAGRQSRRVPPDIWNTLEKKAGR